VADEVGPSLRWATADIKRNERREGGGDGWSGGGGGQSGRSVSNEPAPAPASDPSEEPF
jgi:single-strand DNA-binding protein